MAKRIDVHEEITNRIIEAIEHGAGEFKLPWHRPAGSITRPVNIQSKKAYRGINVVTLWVEAQLKGYAVPVWGTYKQFQEAGCQVRKGEKASLVVFYKEIEFEKDAAELKDGDDPTSSAWLARGYWVFNAEQVDGFAQPEKPPVVEIERNEAVEAFMANTGIETKWGGHSAYYRPSEDAIQMPDRGLFTGTDTTSATEALYATWLHEGVHATGHKSRLDRNFAGKFGAEERSREELVAELGSAFLCADLAVTPTLRDDHAHYIAHWLEILKGDKKAIFTAAAAANRAVEFLHALQPADTRQAAWPPIETLHRAPAHRWGFFFFTRFHKETMMPIKTKPKTAARKSAASKKPRKTTDRNPPALKLIWREITCRVRHTPNYLSKGWSHVELIVQKPKDAPLPITSTGYLSHFLGEDELKRAGGPVQFFLDWIERESCTRQWASTEFKWRQGDLFAWDDWELRNRVRGSHRISG